MNNLDIYTLIFSTPIRQHDVRNQSFVSNEPARRKVNTSLMEKLEEKETKMYLNLEQNKKINIQ